jgi:DNA repair exonuclease SbcCD ATPase subunit
MFRQTKMLTFGMSLGVFGTIFSLWIVTSCSGRKTLSERPIETSPGAPAKQLAIREIPGDAERKEFYVKSSQIDIKEKKRTPSHGSLSSVDDPRSFLMPTPMPVRVGSVIEIKTSSNRLDAGSSADEKGKAKGKDVVAKADEKNQKLEDELMKALPNLEPGTENRPSIVKSFNAKVIEVRENGDAVVSYHRQSIRSDQASDLLIRAVVPQEALSDRDNIKTTQLRDVAIRESLDGEVSDRVSENWEDEYTLRMSGFDEAKSKSAVALDSQKKQLQEARDKVVQQIKSLGQERNSMAKERNDLLDKKAKDDQKITELEKKVAEQDEEIQSLKPKEEENADLAAADGVKEASKAGKPAQGKAGATDKKAAPTAKPAANVAKADANKSPKKPEAAKK